MEALVRKYLWVLDFVVAGACAMLLARATTSLVESRYMAMLQESGMNAASRYTSYASGSSYETTYPKQIEDILKRNIFCSTCPPWGKVEEVATVDGTPKQVEEVRTSLPISLVAIMYAEPPLGWQWSMAIIRDNDSKAQGPFTVGTKIREAKLIEIEKSRIHLDNNGKPEYLDLIDTGPPPAPTPEPAAAAPAAPPSDPLAAALDAGIKKTGEHTYEISRGTMDQVLGNMSLLSRSARIVPEIRDGRPAGFRLYSVRPEGPFAKIGLQNGDVISAINGLEMSSPEKALEVYAKLKSASHLSLGLERNGQKVTKDYTIR